MHRDNGQSWNALELIPPAVWTIWQDIWEPLFFKSSSDSDTAVKIMPDLLGFHLQPTANQSSVAQLLQRVCVFNVSAVSRVWQKPTSLNVSCSFVSLGQQKHHKSHLVWTEKPPFHFCHRNYHWICHSWRLPCITVPRHWNISDNRKEQ